MSGDTEVKNSLEILAKNRDALLLAEIAAWLHMFGKFHEEFLKGRHGIDKEIPEDVKNHFQSLYGLLSESEWTGNVWGKLPHQSELRARGLSIQALIRRHSPPEPKHEGFVKLVQDAHGRGSGIEKGVLLRLAPEHDNENPTCLSTSFGYESKVSDTAIQRDRYTLYNFLQAQLGNLQAQLSSLGKKEQLDTQNWQSFMKRFVMAIENYYLSSVAETRRPANDVTLFDQTAASVAFFKAALAQTLLVGWKEPLPKEVKDKYHWRLLRVGINGMEFWGNSIRIGDLLSRKKLVMQALDEVQALLEVTYPLGLEVYRDEYGSIFVVPDVDHLQNWVDGAQSIKQHIQNIAQQAFLGEATFTLSLSESTRDTLSFGKLVASMLPQAIPELAWLAQQWSHRQEDICPVCGSRPQGPGKKALNRNVCDVCEQRRINRSEEWTKNPSTTIWIDEVADSDGQLVLLVAQFSIVNWLSGIFFNSVLTFDPQSRSLHDKDQESPKPQDYDFDFPTLVNNIQKDLVPGQRFQNNMLHYLLVDKNLESDIVQDFYDLLVADTDLGASSSTPQPELLALALIRQFPAFARITRVWRTTKDFWEKISQAFNTTIYEVSPRLRIKGSFSPGSLGISHTYELKLGNVNLSIVCTKEGEFLTVDNLRRVAILLGALGETRQDYPSAATYVQARLLEDQDRLFDIEEPTGYGNPNRTLGRLYIEVVTLDEIPYVPAITILSEPRTFMALVPADKALNVASSIKDKYEKEMGKVSNRLPLTMGIIFVGKRTPLPAILDAGRRMLKQPVKDECWEIKQTCWKVKVADNQYTEITNPGYPRPSWPIEITLTLVKEDQPLEEQQPLEIKIPTVMGDQTTSDVWYSYWCLEEQTHNPKKRERLFKGIDGKYWTHVSDLQPGDVVSFMPSHLDFEFLDTAARRFEISYDKGKRRGSVHPARPYYLEELTKLEELWQILSNGLATSQIHNLVGFLEAKRMEWLADQNDPVFKEMLREIILNAGWEPHPNKDRTDRLVQAAITGQLTDVVELYMSILDKVNHQ